MLTYVKYGNSLLSWFWCFYLNFHFRATKKVTLVSNFIAPRTQKTQRLITYKYKCLQKTLRHCNFLFCKRKQTGIARTYYPFSIFTFKSRKTMSPVLRRCQKNLRSCFCDVFKTNARRIRNRLPQFWETVKSLKEIRTEARSSEFSFLPAHCPLPSPSL